MNEDFEEDYENEDEYDEGDAIQDAYDNAKDIKEKYDKRKANRAKENDPSQHNQAQDFDKSLKDKNVARSNNPNATGQVGQEATKQAGQEAAKNAATKTATTGASTTGTAATGTAATTGAAATGTAATTGAAATGTAAASGAVAAQAAIPVAGWIALAIEAAIAATVAYAKWRKKKDEQNAENGIDSKGLRKLRRAAPVLFPIAIILIVIVLLIALIQGETYDKVAFAQEAMECFEGKINGCYDFKNTGVYIGPGIIKELEGLISGFEKKEEPLLYKTDLEIVSFAISYKIAEVSYFGYRIGIYVRSV